MTQVQRFVFHTDETDTSEEHTYGPFEGIEGLKSGLRRYFNATWDGVTTEKEAKELFEDWIANDDPDYEYDNCITLPWGIDDEVTITVWQLSEI